MTTPAVDLYRLLPEHHRLRDAEHGYPLRALLEIVAGQVDVVKRDIDGLLDDLFIETCAPWVVPYLGDLVGAQPLPEGTGSRRADVAKTLYYRRRKGTLPMLEELARDVTGWGAHAVAAFELLGWTQALDHVRHDPAPNPTPATVVPPGAPHARHAGAVTRVGTAHVRDPDAMDRTHGPWDETAHTVDVRAPSTREGWHNAPNVLFFLWRLGAYPVQGATPREVPAPAGREGTRFTFSPLGNDAPLFHPGEEESAETARAEERHAPAPIRPLAFYLDLKEHADRARDLPEADKPSGTKVYYGEGRPGPGGAAGGRRLAIRRRRGANDWDLVPAWKVLAMDLAEWPEPPEGFVGVDVARGRFALHRADAVRRERDLRVDYAYGFPADVGGGPYERSSCLGHPLPGARRLVITKDRSVPGAHRTLAGALEAWDDMGRPDAVVEFIDSARYRERVRIEPFSSEEKARHGGDWQSWLVIQAAEGCRPNLRIGGVSGARADLTVQGNYPDAVLTLNGLLVEGGIHVDGCVAELNLSHCTLVPGRALKGTGVFEAPDGPSIHQTPDQDSRRMDVNVVSSVVGNVRLPDAGALCVRDSVVHSPSGLAVAAPDGGPGPALTLERSTVVGRVVAREVAYASDALFVDEVRATRTQSGCVRFSHVPLGSRTPRRYRCQPDLALEGVEDEEERKRIAEAMRPVHESLRFGDPAYAQLSDLAPLAIRRGAEDGSEMGVFSRLRQPHREEALRLRLEEYLPFGLHPGLIFVT